MTDQRYTGPDGAKRLEMLERLARIISKSLDCYAWPVAEIERASAAIDRDNKRADRLKQEAQDAWYVRRGCGTDDDG